MDYLKRAMEIKEEIIANRRYLHQIPELISREANPSARRHM